MVSSSSSAVLFISSSLVSFPAATARPRLTLVAAGARVEAAAVESLLHAAHLVEEFLASCALDDKMLEVPRHVLLRGVRLVEEQGAHSQHRHAHNTLSESPATGRTP